jgi:hypothetical protein
VSGHIVELVRSKEGLDRRRTRRRVSRTFTRLYLDSHIRKQLLTIVRRLRVDALGTDERAKELDAIIRRLETRAGELRGWAGLRSLVAKLPGLSAVVPAIAGVTWGVVSGAGVPSELQVARTPIVVIAVIALIALFGVWLPSVNLGFVVKRALLAGGSLPNERVYLTEESTLVWGEGNVAWMGFPPVNVYRLEDQAAAALGFRKRREPPLDLILQTVAGGYLMAGILLANLALFLGQLNWSWGWGLLWSVTLALVISFVFIGMYFPNTRAAIEQMVGGPRAWRHRVSAGLC